MYSSIAKYAAIVTALFVFSGTVCSPYDDPIIEIANQTTSRVVVYVDYIPPEKVDLPGGVELPFTKYKYHTDTLNSGQVGRKRIDNLSGAIDDSAYVITAVDVAGRIVFQQVVAASALKIEDARITITES